MTFTTFNTPTLLWSQTPESVDISIRLSNIEDESVSCENNHFYFSCSSQSKDYWIEFDLDKSVEKVSYNKYDNRIVIVLEKAEYEKWDFLTKVRGIYKNNIKIDWDKWEDSDAEEEDQAPAQEPSSVGNLGSPLAPSSGFGGMDMDMMRQMMGGMDMDSMRQMMGGMDMGGEEGEEDGDEEDGDEEDGDEGEEGEEEGDEEKEGEEEEREGEFFVNEESKIDSKTNH
jgi:hypothetical protein